MKKQLACNAKHIISPQPEGTSYLNTFLSTFHPTDWNSALRQNLPPQKLAQLRYFAKKHTEKFSITDQSVHQTPVEPYSPNTLTPYIYHGAVNPGTLNSPPPKISQSAGQTPIELYSQNTITPYVYRGALNPSTLSSPTPKASSSSVSHKKIFLPTLKESPSEEKKQKKDSNKQRGNVDPFRTPSKKRKTRKEHVPTSSSSSKKRSSSEYRR